MTDEREGDKTRPTAGAGWALPVAVLLGLLAVAGAIATYKSPTEKWREWCARLGYKGVEHYTADDITQSEPNLSQRPSRGSDQGELESTFCSYYHPNAPYPNDWLMPKERADLNKGGL